MPASPDRLAALRRALRALPRNAKRHPDPEVRRTYARLAKQLHRLSARNRTLGAYCAVRRGSATCGARLQWTRDALGRVSPHCPACARIEAGLCACSPGCTRRIDGDIARGAKYAAACRLRVRRAQNAENDRTNDEARKARQLRYYYRKTGRPELAP